MRIRALVPVLLATSTWLAPARAEPPAAPPPAAATTTPTKPTGEWGWLVVGSGLLAGGALTGVGLSIGCDDGSRECERRASVMIWGGIGIAGLASALGIAIVQAGRARVQASPTAGGFALHGTF